MKMKVYTFKEFEAILKKNGYRMVRQSGDHWIYVNEENRHISILHNRVTLHPGMSRRFIKEYELKVD